MKKVLVIGAHSFIGQQFNNYIHSRNNDIIDITLVSASDDAWRVIDFSQYDTILHLAAIVHKKEKKKMQQLYYKVNYKLAVEIASLAKRCGVKQFIFMSTAAVYDSSIQCITRDTRPNPGSFYGIYKLAAEEEIAKMQSSLFNVVIARSPMVYGDGCKGNYRRLTKLARYLPIFPDYHNKRSMIHINNLCEFFLEIIENNRKGYFFPQDSKYIDTCELFVELRKKMGKKTLLVKRMNKIIKIIMPYNKTINKLFNDFYYVD